LDIKDKKEERMKYLFKSIVGLIIFAIFLTQCSTSKIQTQGYDFRKAKWAMSKEEVKNTDIITAEGTDKAGNPYLLAEDTVADLPCRVGYYFSKAKLMVGGYVFVSEYVNRNEYIEDYERIKRYLTGIYGSPDDEISVWRDNQAKQEYQDDQEHWGNAISRGQLSYFAKWESERTLMQLFLNGGNGKVNLAVRCKSKE